jgi:hypothetical protein
VSGPQIHKYCGFVHTIGSPSPLQWNSLGFKSVRS